jgi:hypothetical protein
VFWVLFRKSFPIPPCSSVYPTASWNCFKVSDLILKSLIHFELILVQSERQGSRFNLQHVNIQFSQSICWRGSFLHHVFWDPLSVVYKCVDLCLDLIFWSIGLLVCFCANTMLFLLLWLCSIVWSQVLWCFQHWTFSQNDFGYLRSFVFPYVFHDIFSISVQNAFRILIGIALNM